MSIRFVAIALFALVTGFAMPRAADAAATTNYSDVWWNPNESGWGVNISQQVDFLFVSFFVYGPNNQSIWYTAQLTFVGQAANGDLVFTGDNYVTTGPWFGGVFNPAQVGIRKVGTATFTATSVISGTLTYAVDGVNVSKSLVRQTLKTESLSGTYLMGQAFTATCSDPTLNGSAQGSDNVTIAHNGSNFQMVEVDVETGDRCVSTGTYVQDGQMGRVAGTYSCASGEAGSFSMVEIQSSISGFMGRYNLAGSLGGISCVATGRAAAVRKTF